MGIFEYKCLGTIYFACTKNKIKSIGTMEKLGQLNTNWYL